MFLARTVECGASLLLLVAVVALVQAQAPGEGCDWSGSGLDYDEQERGVQPVYLRCAQGKVDWKYPRGALRVVLRRGTSSKDFKGCLKAGKHFYGARIYLEGHRTLHLLYSPNDGHHAQLPRCFTSRHGQVALYVEAEPSQTSVLLKRNAVEFSYDLQLKPHSNYVDSQEECKPCNDAELLRHYCTADFLAKGTISGIYQNEELQRTELMIRAKQVVRQNVAVFHPEEELDFHGMYGTVHVPISCGAKHGGGQFLFMGRMMLDNPVLMCAPRLEEWDAVRKVVLRNGSNQCDLS